MSSIKKIVITGPESTGKSTLSMQLAECFQTVMVPEFARFYISRLKRPYTFDDIESIAYGQLKWGEELLSKANRFIFFDTHLVIIKIWFLMKYRDYPAWIDSELRKKDIDLFLLCDYDLPWEPDPLRENGGEMRRLLFTLYKGEIEHYNFPYYIIRGNQEERLTNARNAMVSYFNLS